MGLGQAGEAHKTAALESFENCLTFYATNMHTFNKGTNQMTKLIPAIAFLLQEESSGVTSVVGEGSGCLPIGPVSSRVALSPSLQLFIFSKLEIPKSELQAVGDLGRHFQLFRPNTDPETMEQGLSKDYF